MRMPWRKHLSDVEAAQRAAEEAKRAAAAANRRWQDVRREIRTAQELREANGWTEALTDIFGGRA